MDALRTGVSYLAGHVASDLLADTSRGANLAKGTSLLAQGPVIAANAYRALNDLPLVRREDLERAVLVRHRVRLLGDDDVRPGDPGAGT